MFKVISKITCVIFLLFIITDTAFGQTINDALRVSDPGLGFNARALGMGNSYSAVSDDFSAVFFNPAGLGLLRRMEFAGGLNYSKFNNNTAFHNAETDYSNSVTKLDQLSFAFPFPTIRGSLVFAIGYSRNKDFNNAIGFEGFNAGNTSMIQDLASVNDDIAFNLGLSYPENGNDVTLINGRLNQSGTTIATGNIGRWSFAGAVEILKSVYIGGTLNIVSGSFKNTRDYSEEDINGVYRNIQLDPEDNRTLGFNLFTFNETLDWDISGWDAKVGMLFQPTDFTRVGIAINFPTSYKIEETYFVDASSEFVTGQSFAIDPIEDIIEYYINSPYILTGGASFNLNGLILSGEVSYIDYTQMEFDQEDGELSLSKITDLNRDIKDSFRGVANLNVGAEYRIPQSDLRVRGGFMFKPSPYEGDPGEYNRKYITGGLGYLIDESLSLDFGYAYGWWKDFGENYGFNVSRTNQDIKYHNLLMTLSYRF